MVCSRPSRARLGASAAAAPAGQPSPLPMTTQSATTPEQTRSATGDALRLNLGSGPMVVAGWVSVDKSPSVILARYRWLRRLLRRGGVVTQKQGGRLPPGGVGGAVAQ